MKQVFCQLCIPIRILVSFILLITIVIPSYSQELTIVSKQDYHLHDCTPDPYFSRGHFTSTERGDSLKAGDTITIYAFHKSLDWAFVYNQKKTGYISGIKKFDKPLYKQIKKAKVWDYPKDGEEIVAKQREIYLAINDYYNRLADAFDREQFVKDSLEKRNKFIADSIQKRERFIHDSIVKVEKQRQDSIRLKKAQEERELHLLLTANLFKANDPFIIDVKSYFVDHETTMYLAIQFTNCSPKIMKYVTFKGRFFNPVNDPVRELWHGGYTWTAKAVGPMYPAPRTLEEFENPQGKYNGKFEFQNLYYFYPRQIATRLELISVLIEFMDGTKRTYTGKELQKRVVYSCNN